MSGQGVSLQEAARRLNVNEKTVRRRLQSGRLRGEKVPGPRGEEWTVYLSPDRSPDSGDVGGESGQTVQALLDMIREKDRQLLEVVTAKDAAIAALQADKQQLAQQLGMFSERVRNLDAQLRLLEAPKQPPPRRRPWWQFWRRGEDEG